MTLFWGLPREGEIHSGTDLRPSVSLEEQRAPGRRVRESEMDQRGKALASVVNAQCLDRSCDGNNNLGRFRRAQKQAVQDRVMLQDDRKTC